MKYYNFNHANPNDALKRFKFAMNQSNAIAVQEADLIWLETPATVAIIRVVSQRHDAYRLVLHVIPDKHSYFNDASFTLDLFKNIDFINAYEVDRCIKILSFITGLKLNEIDFITSGGGEVEQ